MSGSYASRSHTNTHARLDRCLRRAHRANRTHSRVPRNVVRRPPAGLLLLGNLSRHWWGPQQFALLVEHGGIHRVQLVEHALRNLTEEFRYQSYPSLVGATTTQVLAVPEEVAMRLEQGLAAAQLVRHAAQRPHIARQPPLEVENDFGRAVGACRDQTLLGSGGRGHAAEIDETQVVEIRNQVLRVNERENDDGNLLRNGLLFILDRIEHHVLCP